MWLKRSPMSPRARMRWCWSGQTEAIPSACCIPRRSNHLLTLHPSKHWGGVTGEALSALVSFNSNTLDVTPVEAYSRQYFIIQHGGTAWTVPTAADLSPHGSVLGALRARCSAA